VEGGAISEFVAVMESVDSFGMWAWVVICCARIIRVVVNWRVAGEGITLGVVVALHMGFGWVEESILVPFLSRKLGRVSIFEQMILTPYSVFLRL